MTLYTYLSPLIRLCLWIYFKKIYLIDTDKMPIGKKSLYLLNHPTSFVDPIILATQTNAYLHFLIRGDVFKKGIILKLLNGINAIPIFRATDSRNAKDKNKDTFDRIASVLHENGSVMIMPEGSTDKRRKLRPFKKGFAHMAVHYWQKYNLDDINIVPVSLSYSDPTKFRSVVHVKFDDPILLKDYIKNYEENNVQAINELRDNAYQVMRKNIVHIEKDEDAYLVDQLIRMDHNSHDFSILPVKDKSDSLLQKEIRTTEYINQLAEPEKAQLTKKVKDYKNRLTKEGLYDAVISGEGKWNPLSTLLLFFIAPVALLGYLVNFLPIYAGKRIAHKLMKRDEFICSVKIGAALIFYHIYIAIVVLLGLIFLPWLTLLIILISLPISGVVYLYFRGAYKRQTIRFKRSLASNKLLDELKSDRSEIRTYIKEHA
jgi:glycerol-3-phosphate O-acyltransferase/dihydroxyacetone phosphate acyltransferase